MTIEEIIKQLIKAEDYEQIRGQIPDIVINFIKQTLPSDYEYFAEKEDKYQKSIEE